MISTERLLVPSQVPGNHKRFHVLLTGIIYGRKTIAGHLKREQHLARLEAHFGLVNCFCDHKYTLTMDTPFWQVTMKHLLAIHEQHKLRLKALHQEVSLRCKYKYHQEQRRRQRKSRT